MNKFDSVSPAARTWRDIPQTVASRAMSAEGRRRRAFSAARVVTLLAVVGVSAWGAFEIWKTTQETPQAIAAAGRGEPVKTIELRTDGVLDLAWVGGVLALPRNVALMELDLPGLQTRLMSNGQVQSAVLQRRFPSTLIVTLQERSPVARIRASFDGQVQSDFVVARDGTVYAGSHYQPELIDSLPWLSGVPLTRSGDGFRAIAGMEKLADLLTMAQANTPALYRSWKIVDLTRLAADGEIVVRSDAVPEVIFGVRDDFFTQLALLDATLEQISLNPALGQPSRVNLAVGGRQVPVAFGGPAPRAPERATPPTRPALFRTAPISLN